MDFVSLGTCWKTVGKEVPNHECVGWDSHILGAPKEVSGYAPELAPNLILRLNS